MIAACPLGVNGGGAGGSLLGSAPRQSRRPRHSLGYGGFGGRKSAGTLSSLFSASKAKSQVSHFFHIHILCSYNPYNICQLFLFVCFSFCIDGRKYATSPILISCFCLVSASVPKALKLHPGEANVSFSSSCVSFLSVVQAWELQLSPALIEAAIKRLQPQLMGSDIEGHFSRGLEA